MKYYLNSSNINEVTNPIEKDEEIKSKLQQLREGIGYYDGKSNGSLMDHSTSRNNNHSLLLPELKQIGTHNQKQNYSVLGGVSGLSQNLSYLDTSVGGPPSLLNKKKSYDRINRIDH